MAALDSFRAEAFPWPRELVDTLRAEIAKHLWTWFEEHRDDVLFERKFLVFRLRIRLNDCRALVEMLLGPQPA